MSAEQVFEKLRIHFLSTGKVMREEKFKNEVVNKHKTNDVIEGLMIFNSFLDNQRKDVS